MKITKIDIGAIVKAKVEEKKMTYSKFAESIGLQRQNIRRSVFEKQSLDTALLIRISETLNYNFFQLYLECNAPYYKKECPIKATITIEMGEQKQDKVITFNLGENCTKIE